MVRTAPQPRQPREPEWLIRLRIERAQLFERVSDLRAFLSGPVGPDEFHVGLLRAQLTAMQAYLDILDIRLRNLTKEAR